MLTISEIIRLHSDFRRILIRFKHGLGDALMFNATCLKALREAFPDVEFAFSTHLGQQDVFGEIDEGGKYDAVFDLAFPMAEYDSGNETKAEKCARIETGAAFKVEDYRLNQSFTNPLVALHFHSTCLKALCIPDDFAKRLWEQIEDEGFIPIDTHLRHPTDNAPPMAEWQSRNLEGIKATVPKLLGLIGACNGFIGTSSGNFFCALSMLEARKIMFIKTAFDVEKLTRLPVWVIDANRQYDKCKVHDFLESLKVK